MRTAGFCLIVLIAFVALAAPAFAEKRVALVIGNGSYQFVGALPNPPRDAEAMAGMFRAAGFDEVRVEINAGIAAMRRALRAFADKAADADTAVVFFAGHGVEIGGRNYLIPVDAALKTDLDVEDETVDLDRVLQLLDPVKRLKLVILDACRDNPLARYMKLTKAGRSAGRGLAPPEPQTSNTLVAYAARAGTVAADGDGRNSPFTAALLNNLTKPGIDVRIALGLVHDEVLQATRRKQEPFLYGALGGGTLALAPDNSTAAPARPSPPPTTDTRQADFDAVMEAGTIGALDAFLAKYPSGPLANIARRERDKLKVAAVTPAAPPASVQPTFVPDPEVTCDSFEERLTSIFSREGMSRSNFEIAGNELMRIGKNVSKSCELKGNVFSGPIIKIHKCFNEATYIELGGSNGGAFVFFDSTKNYQENRPDRKQQWVIGLAGTSPSYCLASTAPLSVWPAKWFQSMSFR